MWSLQTGSAVPSCVSLLILYTQAESGAYSRDSSHFPRRRPSMYTVNATGSVPSLSGQENAYLRCSLPRVRRHRASSLQANSSNGCCLFRYPHGPILVPLYCRYSTADICDTKSIGGGTITRFLENSKGYNSMQLIKDF